MALSEMIPGLAGAIAEAREALTDIERQIAELGTERHTIATAMPHTDDIVAVFEQGLDVAEEEYREALGWHLNDSNLARETTASMVDEKISGRGNQLRATRALRPSPEYLKGLFPPDQKRMPLLGEISLLPALGYFLRPLILDRLPELVETLCPLSKDGMKRADRERQLEQIDEQLADLRERRDELAGQLASASRATGEPSGS